jgi:hypothetical protein
MWRDGFDGVLTVMQLPNLDAEKRMSLDDVLVHPWIVGHVDKLAQSG